MPCGKKRKNRKPSYATITKGKHKGSIRRTTYKGKRKTFRYTTF